MKAIRRASGGRELVAFFALAYVLSWWAVPLSEGSLIPYGPFLAALIVLALGEGRKGIADLFRRMAQWRVRWYWYLIAPGLVLIYLLAALAVNLALGASNINTSHLRSASDVASRALMLLVLGGHWEEPGWTGYALPRLQERYANRPHGLLKATLLMGALRGVWHLPLVLYGHIPWYDAAFFAIGMQLLVTWVFNRTRGSVLMVMLLHLTSNIIGGAIMVPLFSGLEFTRFYVFFVTAALMLGLLLAQHNGWSMGTRPGQMIRKADQ